MRSSRIQSIVFVSVVILIASAYAGARPPSKKTIFAGVYSGIAEPRTVVIRQPKEWEALWKEHTKNQIPPPAVPAIDFSKGMVLGVFAGQKPTAGYRVTITQINLTPEALVVRYHETPPPADMATAEVLTQPYELQVFPKTPLPVRFAKQ